MKAEQNLSSVTVDWVDHPNQLGNEGAHLEDYDDATHAEATELGQFVRTPLSLEYDMRAQAAAGSG